MTAIAFALNPLMSGDEALKEMHAQIAASNSGNKATMQAILVVVMSYEYISSSPGRSLQPPALPTH